MSQVILSPKSKSDLSDIWDYTLAEWGIDQAEKYVRELWTAMQEQACDPSIFVAIRTNDAVRRLTTPYKTAGGHNVLELALISGRLRLCDEELRRTGVVARKI
jgi:plasmid stabilization system protein ParE